MNTEGSIRTNFGLWRCFNCKLFDRKKSNEHWVVCLDMPLDVMVDKKSDDCENYVGKREQNSSG